VAAEGGRKGAAVAKKGWGGLGMRVTRATDAAHPAGSLRLAQIGARGGF
jgi:hypothetical protein